jgi:CDGSH-type Zn-finger protein
MNTSNPPRPIIIELAPGKHAICACGRTASAPYCDGSHRGTEFTPVIERVEDTPRKLAWCTCRLSNDMPRCDGSHRPCKP